ncbi:MAG: hypothetical protein GYB31_13580 [Bacteroidetes bacterium]|nr:hypothetical protein [Bacteroidota bacterium]
MKRFILLFALAGFFSINMQAQCSHAKAADEKASTEAEAAEAAALAAADDATIQARKSASTGEVSYVRTVSNTETGTTSFEEVEYCTKSNKFVAVKASEMKSCSKSKASCSSATAGAKKAGCCSAGAAAGCCSSKAKAADAKAAAPATQGAAKAVSAEKKGGA